MFVFRFLEKTIESNVQFECFVQIQISTLNRLALIFNRVDKHGDGYIIITQRGLNAVMGLTGWRRSHFRTWSLSDSFPVAPVSTQYGWVMNGLELLSSLSSHSCFRLEFTSHQQPLSRRGCCKVKSVRVFGDITDEWSQVEWSRQKETPFIQHSK